MRALRILILLWLTLPVTAWTLASTICLWQTARTNDPLLFFCQLPIIAIGGAATLAVPLLFAHYSRSSNNVSR